MIKKIFKAETDMVCGAGYCVCKSIQHNAGGFSNEKIEWHGEVNAVEECRTKCCIDMGTMWFRYSGVDEACGNTGVCVIS